MSANRKRLILKAYRSAWQINSIPTRQCPLRNDVAHDIHVGWSVLDFQMRAWLWTPSWKPSSHFVMYIPLVCIYGTDCIQHLSQHSATCLSQTSSCYAMQMVLLYNAAALSVLQKNCRLLQKQAGYGGAEVQSSYVDPASVSSHSEGVMVCRFEGSRMLPFHMFGRVCHDIRHGLLLTSATIRDQKCDCAEEAGWMNAGMNLCEITVSMSNSSM